MEALKKNYDRVILVVVAILAVAVSVLLAMKSFGFSERFKQTTPAKSDDLGETGIEITENAIEHYGKTVEWTSPSMPGVEAKKLPLFKSVAVVLEPGPDGVGGELIDLRDPSSKILRPPISNIYLVDNNLEYLRSDVNLMDPDKDGFTNEQEFSWGQTDPNDPKSFPGFERQLYLHKKESIPYLMMFQGAAGETLTVRRSEPNRSTFYARLNVPFEDKDREGYDGARFTATKYEKKEEKNDATQLVRDVSELTIHDTETEMDYTLVYRVPLDIPIEFAIFRFALPGFESWEKKVKVRESFSLPNDPKTSYKLESVTENGAKISTLVDGTPKILEISDKVTSK
jgi:hypothetical protein